MMGVDVHSAGPAHADCIELRGVTGHGRHGVFDFERTDGQEFVVDVVIFPAPGVMKSAAESDEIDQAINYADVAGIALSHITGKPVNLIETLATNIADAILVNPRVVHVCVTVHKPRAPLAMEFADVIVTVHREPRS